MKSERFDFIDITKAYLIILVIVGHVLIIMNPLYDKLYLILVQEGIYSFHMASFFLIHGMLTHDANLKRTDIKEFISKRAYMLIIPYVFFEILGIIIRYLTQKQPILAGVKNLFTIRCNVGADWFLPAMFLGSLLFFFSIKYLNKSASILMMIASFVLAALLPKSQLAIVITRGLLAYGFMMIGCLGKALLLGKKQHNYILILLSAMIIGVCSICNLKIGGNDFYTGVINNLATLIIGGCAGTIMMIEIARLFSNRYLILIGRHTLTVMGTHQLIIYIMSALIPNLSGNISLCLVVLVLIIIVEIPLVYFVDNYLPFFVGRKVINKEVDRL